MRFLKVFAVFNMNLASALPLGCSASFDFMATLLFTTLAPIGVSLVLLLLFSVQVRSARRRYDKKKKKNALSLSEEKRNEQDYRHEHERLKDKYLNYFFYMTYLVLTSVTTTIFATFICTNVDPDSEDSASSDSFLTADMSISCTSHYYYNYVAYAVVMVFVYPIGIPAMYFYLLYQNRKEIMERDNDSSAAVSNTSEVNSDGKKTKKESLSKDVYEAEGQEAFSAVTAVINPMMVGCDDDVDYSDSDDEVIDSDDDDDVVIIVDDAIIRRRSTLALDQAKSASPAIVSPADNKTNAHGVKDSLPPLSASASRLSFLFSAYKPELWYWEVIETMRRLLLTAILGVCGPGSSAQGFMALVLALFYIELYGQYKPYDSPVNNIIARVGQYQIYFTFWGALIMLYDGLGKALDGVISAFLIIVNLGVMSLFTHFELSECINLGVTHLSRYFDISRWVSESYNKAIGRRGRR